MKTTLDVIREMTQRIRESNTTSITEKRYQYSKDECETIFNNIFNAVEEYTKKNTDADAYESLLNSISDRFKVSPTGGDISRQVDSMSSAEDLYNNQPKFQEMLDSAKDIAEFIRDKAEKLEGISINKASAEHIESPAPEGNPEEGIK